MAIKVPLAVLRECFRQGPYQQTLEPRTCASPEYDPHTYDPQQSYSAKQLSRYDMEVAGVVGYIVAMTVFFVVALVMMLFGNETVNQAHAQAATVEHHSVAPQSNKPTDLAQARVQPNR